MQWNTKADNITTNLKVKVNFTLPKISATNIVIWKCHVDESANGRYDIILGRDLLSELELNFKSSDHAIEAYDGPSEGFTTPIVDLGTYKFKNLNSVKITPGE